MSKISLGKIFGIKVNLDPSWLLIFILVTADLAFGIFPILHPEWSLLFNLFIGLVASVLFFASVLAHEIAHSIVATRKGLPVTEITLFVFGGVSNIQKEPQSPGTEFLVAIVGPLTSLILGGIFIFLGDLSLGGLREKLIINPTATLSSLSPLATIFLWLGPTNLLLGIFNLIPGFPLDGGRVLRSIIWAINKNLERATRYASLVGQGVAWVFILIGLSMVFGVRVPFFGTGLISGLWLAFIGWFLNNLATQSYEQVVITNVLDKVPVEQIMSKEIPRIFPETSVSDLVYKHIMGTDNRTFAVLKDDEILGIVSLDDVRKIPKKEWRGKIVTDIMTPAEALETISQKESGTAALQKIAQKDIGQVLVIDNGKLIGLVGRREILLWLQINTEK